MDYCMLKKSIILMVSYWLFAKCHLLYSVCVVLLRLNAAQKGAIVRSLHLDD